MSVEAQSSGLPVLYANHLAEEAGLLKQTKRLSLQAGPQAWADTLLQLSAVDRSTAADVVRTAGFDVLDTAKRLETLYREGNL